MTASKTAWAAWALATWLGAAGAARAQPVPAPVQDPRREARVEQVRQGLAREPSVAQVQQRALRFFEVHPEAVASLRGRATGRAGLPQVRVGYDLDLGTSTEDYVGSGALSGQVATNDASARGHHATAQLIWFLPGAVFDPAEVSTYALTGVQLSVLREVTRLYFTRRQILLALVIDPPADPRARLALELRVQEQTAMIDAMTGGWYSRELLRRSRRR